MPSERFIAKQSMSEQLDLTALVERLRKVLAKRRKVELIEALVDLAIDERKVLRQLESQFNVQAPVDDLVTSTRQAITDATAFDERRINYNFDYDDQAYETVQRNLRRLVELEAFKDAKELSLELMSRGSYQVEMSDEGLMTEDIEACLRPVIDGLGQSDLPTDSIVQWCDAMSRADRGGFICDQELASLGERFAG